MVGLQEERQSQPLGAERSWALVQGVWFETEQGITKFALLVRVGAETSNETLPRLQADLRQKYGRYG